MNTHFTNLHKEYIFWLDTLNFNYTTSKRWGARLIDFFQWLESKNITSIKQIKQHHLIEFLEYQQNRPYKKNKSKIISLSYINHYGLVIDKFCEFLNQMGATTNITPTNYRIPPNGIKRINKIQPFSIKEIKILQSKINDVYPHFDYEHRLLKINQLNLVFALYYGCGLRISEGEKLTRKEIDFNRKTVFVQQGKGYKDRIVPMSKGVYKALQDYIYNFRNQIKTNHSRLFLQKTETIRGDLKHLQDICDNEQIKSKRLYFHILRHSIATHLLQKGMDIENIAKFLGHSCLESTQIYTHIINR